MSNEIKVIELEADNLVECYESLLNIEGFTRVVSAPKDIYED